MQIRSKELHSTVYVSPSILRNVLTRTGVPDVTLKDTPVTATGCLTESVARSLRRAYRRNMCDTAIDYLIQRSTVLRYVVLECENSPWVVVHGDLHNGNIIVDEDFNLRVFVKPSLCTQMYVDSF
jgi:hypothetical protein